MVANKNIEKFDLKHFEKFLILPSAVSQVILNIWIEKNTNLILKQPKNPNYFPNYGNINSTF